MKAVKELVYSSQSESWKQRNRKSKSRVQGHTFTLHRGRCPTGCFFLLPGERNGKQEGGGHGGHVAFLRRAGLPGRQVSLQKKHLLRQPGLRKRPRRIPGGQIQQFPRELLERSRHHKERLPLCTELPFMELPCPWGRATFVSPFHSWENAVSRKRQSGAPCSSRRAPQWLIPAVPLRTSAWRLCVRPPCQTPPRLESCWGPLQTSMCGGKTVPLLLLISIKTSPPSHKVIAGLILLKSV